VTRTGPMLALVPGPRQGPGTGANTDHGAYVPPRDVYAADSAFTRARDGYLIRRVRQARPPTAFDPGIDVEIIPASTINPGAYTAWLDHIWPAAACTHPIRLHGVIRRVDASTGEILTDIHTEHDLPDGVIYTACGNRRARSCPGCAETYRRDAFQLIRAGLTGGKGVPAHVATHPAVFATFTAPSFGPVHTRPVRQHTCTDRSHCRCRPQPCHARRDSGTCPHGRPLACFTRHTRDDPALGQPLCPDCYDYPAHVVWNNNAGELWRRTKQAIERRLNQAARRRGLPRVRVSHGKAAEYQARGAVHFHVLLRLDGFDEHDPGRLLPPPPGITAADLDDATRHAASAIAYRTAPHRANPAGWPIGWGHELDVRVITLRGTGPITDLAVASYLAKYSTKGTEVTGHASARITRDTVKLYANCAGNHAERLIHACWALGAHPDYRSLRRWAHMLGFGGHFLTKARAYSIRFRDLRDARIAYRRTQDTGPEHGPIRTADHADEETTLVIGTLTYTGTGWRTTGDAMLANTAADQARKRRQAGHEQLADEFDCATTGRKAA
jgi:hypothetical protein